MILAYLIFCITSGFIYSYIVLPSGEKDCPAISPTIYLILHNYMVEIPISGGKVFHVQDWMFTDLSLPETSPFHTCINVSSG